MTLKNQFTHPRKLPPTCSKEWRLVVWPRSGGGESVRKRSAGSSSRRLGRLMHENEKSWSGAFRKWYSTHLRFPTGLHRVPAHFNRVRSNEWKWAAVPRNLTGAGAWFLSFWTTFHHRVAVTLETLRNHQQRDVRNNVTSVFSDINNSNIKPRSQWQMHIYFTYALHFWILLETQHQRSEITRLWHTATRQQKTTKCFNPNCKHCTDWAAFQTALLPPMTAEKTE